MRNTHEQGWDDTHFAFLMEKDADKKTENHPQKEAKEIQLDKELVVSIEKRAAAYKKLDAITSFSQPKDPEAIKYRARFYDLLYKVIKEKSNSAQETLENHKAINSIGTLATELEAELLMIFCALDNTAEGNTIASNLGKIKKAYSISGANKNISGEVTNKHFPNAAGIISAVTEYKKLINEAIPEDMHRKIFLHSEFDAKFATDFITILYGKDGQDNIVIENLQFI